MDRQGMSEQETTRPIPVTVGPNGEVIGHTVTSPASNTVGGAMMIPAPDVVPIIFVPGIMGSNLRAARDIVGSTPDMKKGEQIWRVDSGSSFAKAWTGKSASQRQLLIDYTVLEPDPNGLIELRPEEKQPLPRAYAAFGQSSDDKQRELDQRNATVEYKRGCGWGTVAWAFYGEFLNWLDGSLQGIGMDSPNGRPNPKLQNLLHYLVGHAPVGATSAPEPLTEVQVKQMLKFRLPIHAFGYNWAASNLDSGAKLAQYITDTIRRYDGKRGQTCSKVILVTHSMGGLVARAAVKASDAEDKVLGVVHGVMPTHGAAAMYKRFVAGFGREGNGPIATITNRALGNTAKETSCILAFNPGPLELAPNKLYNDGKPWLFICDVNGAVLESQPVTGDPYKDIYRNATAWWRPAHVKWMNPAGTRGDPDYVWGQYLKNVDQAEKYHARLSKQGFHANTTALYSEDSNFASWGTLEWKAMNTGMYQAGTPVSSPVENWTVSREDGDGALFMHNDSNATLSAAIDYGRDAGDGTVPAIASAAGVDRHASIVCRHTPGYEHSASYNDQRVRIGVLDSLARMLQKAPVG
jgi:pimeloyl-ACP methyl ester carboxylesterase